MVLESTSSASRVVVSDAVGVVSVNSVSTLEMLPLIELEISARDPFTMETSVPLFMTSLDSPGGDSK